MNKKSKNYQGKSKEELFDRIINFLKTSKINIDTIKFVKIANSNFRATVAYEKLS